MSYLTFEPTTYDYPEHDRVRDYQPEYRTPGEDDLWADHTRSCAYTEKEVMRNGKYVTRLVPVQDIRVEQPLDHNDLEVMDAYGNDLEADRKEREATDADTSKGVEVQLPEATTRTASDKRTRIRGTLWKCRFIANTDTPLDMRLAALRRIYRRTTNETTQKSIARIAAEIKAEAAPHYAVQA